MMNIKEALKIQKEIKEEKELLRQIPNFVPIHDMSTNRIKHLRKLQMSCLFSKKGRTV